MAIWRCLFCKGPLGFDFEANDPECPSCHAGPPAVIPRVAVHFLFPEQATGPIAGQAGRRFRHGCDPAKSLLRGEPASDDVRAVTCPKCQATAEYRTGVKALRDIGVTIVGPTDLNE